RRADQASSIKRGQDPLRSRPDAGVIREGHPPGRLRSCGVAPLPRRLQEGGVATRRAQPEMPPLRKRFAAEAMRVLVLDSGSWREMGIARALDPAADVTPVLERDLGDQTLSKSLASVVLLSEASARSDARRSVSVVRRKFPHAKILVHGEQSDPAVIADF